MKVNISDEKAGGKKTCIKENVRKEGESGGTLSIKVKESFKRVRESAAVKAKAT